MEKIKSLLAKVEISEVSGSPAMTEKEVDAAKATEARHQEGQTGKDHVDAVNQMFAEFELAYHNQYHKAYARAGSVGVAKKYWLSCLSGYSPELILAATRNVVSSEEYLPSVASIIQACEEGMTLLGLPSAHDAYVEACSAPSPKARFTWSHPVVYFAAKATDWFALANSPESQIYPLFEYHYKLLCTRVMKGEQLEMKIPEAIPEPVSRVLSSEENIARLDELRKNLKL